MRRGDRVHVKQEQACRIVARSLFRELTASGYRISELLAVATEFLDLVVRDAGGARKGAAATKTRDPVGSHASSDRTSPRQEEASMHFENVVRFIRELDVDTRGVTLDSRLGADIGMDSQEIVELVLLVEKAYGIAVPGRSLSKGSTVREVVGHIERLMGARGATAPAGLDHRCEARAVIRRPRVDVYRALHRIEEWTRHLPHVVGLDVLYDDGRYQEFKMRVAGRTGVLEVRSVRDCDGVSSIDFFQPEPPPFLSCHAGGWRFTELEGGQSTEVVTFHEWRLNEPVARETFAGGPLPFEEQAREMLLEHAKIALGHWKRVLEAGRPRAGASDERAGDEGAGAPISSSTPRAA